MSGPVPCFSGSSGNPFTPPHSLLVNTRGNKLHPYLLQQMISIYTLAFGSSGSDVSPTSSYHEDPEEKPLHPFVFFSSSSLPATTESNLTHCLPLHPSAKLICRRAHFTGILLSHTIRYHSFGRGDRSPALSGSAKNGCCLSCPGRGANRSNPPPSPPHRPPGPLA